MIFLRALAKWHFIGPCDGTICKGGTPRSREAHLDRHNAVLAFLVRLELQATAAADEMCRGPLHQRLCHLYKRGYIC